MKPSRVLLASIFITAVILAMIGGISSLAMANAKTAASEDTTVEVFQQREAEYQQLIEQANQQLAEANQKLQAVQVQNTPAQQNSPTATSLPVSAEQAEQAARQFADPLQAFLKNAGLVSFEGRAAYELVFQNGSIFIDAQTGDMLFNGTIPQEIDANKAVQIASDYLKNKDVLQADQISFRGAPLFRVIFKNGMMVYMDLTGQITYMLKSSPKVIVQEVSSGGGGGAGYFESDHEEHEDEHENEHDD